MTSHLCRSASAIDDACSRVYVVPTAQYFRPREYTDLRLRWEKQKKADEEAGKKPATSSLGNHDAEGMCGRTCSIQAYFWSSSDKI